MASDTKTISRRQALRRGAAAGAVVWAVPMVTSTTAHASGGSNGSRFEGRLDSVTCVWDRRYFQPNRGTPTQPKHDYSTDVFCEINVGRGWQLLARNDTFTIAAGQVLQMRPWSGRGGGRSVDVSTDEVDAPVEPTEQPAPETTVAPTAPEPAPGPTPTTPAPAVEATTTTLPPASPPVTPPTAGYVDTIVIDMTGRTEINIGDVYGYFRVVDAEPA